MKFARCVSNGVLTAYQRPPFCAKLAGVRSGFGIVCAILFSFGCEQQRPPGMSSPRVVAANSATSLESRRLLTFEHDFGLVRPRDRVRHAFTIKNNDSVPWTVKRVHVNCACTVPHMSAAVIDPGETLTADLVYKAGRESGDDKRVVSVEFCEPTAPLAQLVVRAKVRGAITAVPGELNLGQAASPLEAQGHLDLQNYSDEDWRSLSVRTQSDADWLTARVRPVVRGSALPSPGPDAPRQVWRVTAHARTTALAPGDHRAHLEVTALGGREEKLLIPVNLNLVSPVQAIPGQFFFGRVTTGAAATRKIVIAFAPNTIPRDPQSVSFEQVPAGSVSLEWSRTTGRFWELTAQILSGGTESVNGHVRVIFSDSRLPDLLVPIHALAQEPP